MGFIIGFFGGCLAGCLATAFFIGAVNSGKGEELRREDYEPQKKVWTKEQRD